MLVRAHLSVFALLFLFSAHSLAASVHVVSHSQTISSNFTRTSTRDLVEITEWNPFVTPQPQLLHFASNSHYLYMSNGSREIQVAKRMQVAQTHGNAPLSFSRIRFSQNVTKCSATTTRVCCVAPTNSIICKQFFDPTVSTGPDTVLVLPDDDWDEFTDGVVDIVAGANHFCILSAAPKSAVYCWGSNTRGQLGTEVEGNLAEDYTSAYRVMLPHSIRSLSCGGDSCAAASTDDPGQVFVWGRIQRLIAPESIAQAAHWARVTVAHQNSTVPVSRVLVQDETVLTVSTLANSIHVFGALDHGHAGNCVPVYTTTRAEDAWAPDQSLFQQVARPSSGGSLDVTMSASAVMGITPERDAVFGWGHNRHAELGRNAFAPTYVCPHLIEFRNSSTGAMYTQVPLAVHASSIGTVVVMP